MGRVIVNLTRLRRVRAIVRADMSGSGRGPFHRAFERWGERYLSFSRENFRRLSQGGWQELAARTKADRKQQGFGESRPILIRSLTLLHALYRGGSGNLFQRIRNGIRVGFGGTDRHGGYSDGSSGKLTIARIAEIHHIGLGNNPKRQIFHWPDAALRALIAADLRQAFRELKRII